MIRQGNRGCGGMQPSAKAEGKPVGQGAGAQLGPRELSVAAAGAVAAALAQARGEFEGEGKPASACFGSFACDSEPAVSPWRFAADDLQGSGPLPSDGDMEAGWPSAGLRIGDGPEAGEFLLFGESQMDRGLLFPAPCPLLCPRFSGRRGGGVRRRDPAGGPWRLPGCGHTGRRKTRRSTSPR